MDLQEYQEKIKALAAAASTIAVESVIIPAANELLAETKNRIILDGKKSDGTLIGSYSNKPGYYGVNAFDKKGSFKPQGKKESVVYGISNVKTKKTKVPKRATDIINGKKTAVRNQQGFNAEIRKTMYLPGGYKELRNLQGKPIDKTNENYSGQTNLDFQLGQEPNAVVIGFVTERSSKIRKGQEQGTSKMKGKGDIWKPTKEELDKYQTTVVEEINQLTAHILNA